MIRRDFAEICFTFGIATACAAIHRFADAQSTSNPAYDSQDRSSIESRVNQYHVGKGN